LRALLKLFQEPLILGVERRATEQVWAVAQSFFEGFLAAPAADFLVIPANEDFGDIPAAKRRRAGVMRIIENSVIRESQFVIRDSCCSIRV